MNQSINEKTRLSDEQAPGKLRILVAPLDWGLGHATRCIPIIRELQAQGCDVWLAGERAQEELLKTEFPDLPFLNLPGYRVKYSKTKRGLIWRMIQQGPKLKLAIQFEHNWLKKTVKKYKFDALISDNRYGLYHSTIPCIFITHQLRIKSLVGKWTENMLQRRNYSYINRFTECWVPDLAGAANLAGELSHPTLKPAVPIHYIGLLSRFEKKEEAELSTIVKKNNLLVILSGPEPQRSILEEKIINEISHYHGTATIVRGLPDSPSHIPFTDMIKVYNHLPSEALNMAMEEAEFVICRSGYSSVMDIAIAKKKSILIPTPGQTEQEYLANYYQKNQYAFCIQQENFDLTAALKNATDFKFQPFPHCTGEELVKNVRRLITNVL